MALKQSVSDCRNAACIATKNVLVNGDRFKVLRPHTRSTGTSPRANVVEGQSNGYRANDKFIGEAMSDYTFGVTDMEPTVPLRVAVTTPNPTGLGLMNLRPEALFNRWAGIYSGWHRIFLSVSTGRDVSASPPHSILHQAVA